MARKPSPWYRSERDEWWVRIAGQDHMLGKHPQDAPRPKRSQKTKKWNTPKEIEEAFYKLMRGENSRPTDDEAVVCVFDDFITWCKENRAERTWKRYLDFIQDFITFQDGGLKFGQLSVSELNSGHVTKWLNDRQTWNATTKKNAITALMRGLNWAVKNRGLEKNPIKGMEKPQTEARTETITPEEFEQILRHASPEFQDLLIVSYDSGARPQEIKGLESRHIEIELQRAKLETKEAKGKRRPRVIYFPTDRSMNILKRLCGERDEGKLFLNTRGRPWTGFSVKCAFERIQISVGIEIMKQQNIESEVTEQQIEKCAEKLCQTKKHRITGKIIAKSRKELRKEAEKKLIADEAKKYARRIHQYMFRRTRITEMIIAGVDSHVVAQLSGHSNTDMIDRHYSAVAKDHDFLLEQAKKGINPKKDS